MRMRAISKMSPRVSLEHRIPTHPTLDIATFGPLRLATLLRAPIAFSRSLPALPGAAARASSASLGIKEMIHLSQMEAMDTTRLQVRHSYHPGPHDS